MATEDEERAEEMPGDDAESPLGKFLDEDLPAIILSAARGAPLAPSGEEVRQLRREEAEEKKRWEGRSVGGDYEGEGRYEVVRLRRFGMMASLFYGHDRKLSRDVVIKIPRLSAYVKGDEDDAELADMKANIRNNFRREYDALIKLGRCPYVVRMLDFGELPDGRPFMVQELIEGMNALELLNASQDDRGGRSGLAFERAAEIVRHAGCGLEAAHNHDILHHDVKAENIMYDGVLARLIDFNAADVRLPVSPMSTVLKVQMWGTLGYVSPEQLTNMLETDPDREPIRLTRAADVYSLAVTAYQLLTGRMPFSSSVKELIEQQAACAFTPAGVLRPGVPAEIDELLAKALARDPSERPQSAREFGEAFARALERTGTAPTRPIKPGPPAPSPPARPQPLPLSKAAAAAAVLVLLLAAGYAAWRVVKDRGEANPGAVASATPPAPAPTRSFSYRLESSGPGPFKSGDSFVLNFVSPQSGHVYLLNEGRNHQGRTTFYYIAALPVTAQQVVASEPLVFDDTEGTEKFWVVFSDGPLELFEMYDAPRELPADKTVVIRNYLGARRPADLSVASEEARTVVKSSSAVIAHVIALPHRKAS